jgi:hypothetical protein
MKDVLFPKEVDKLYDNYVKHLGKVHEKLRTRYNQFSMKCVPDSVKLDNNLPMVRIMFNQRLRRTYKIINLLMINLIYQSNQLFLASNLSN